VWHDSAGLFCYDFEGKELWSRDLGEFYHLWGHGGSPILYQGKVLLNCSPGKNVFMTALDLETGKTLWKTDEPQELKPETVAKGFGDYNTTGGWVGSWCTPIVVKVEGKDQIVCTQPTRVVAYDPKDGRIIWWCNGIRSERDKVTHDLAYSSPVVAGDVIVATGGFGGPALGVRLGGAGDVTASHRLWWKKGNPQSIGSGVFLGDHVYIPFDGQIECRDPKTGKTVWQDRVRGGIWGSIVHVAGRCYVTDRNGATVVFKAGPEKMEVLATNELGEKSNSTPAVSDGEIFIRTFKHLYCIAE
jgi:outer membrane protein assembly factor BamB